MYQIKKITLIPIALTMLQAFETAHHTISERPLTIVTVELLNEDSGDIAVGYGEVQSFADFSYTLENQSVSREILKTVLLPQIRRFSFSNPQSFSIRLNQLTPFASFAKAGLEMAVWDAIGKLTHQSLQQMIHGQGGTVPVGIAVGMADSIDEALTQGYQRIKLKIDAHVVDFENLNRLLKNILNNNFQLMQTVALQMKILHKLTGYLKMLGSLNNHLVKMILYSMRYSKLIQVKSLV
jgi:O-succinylbenzoate synthase (EC 4.2.1.-)